MGPALRDCLPPGCAMGAGWGGWGLPGQCFPRSRRCPGAHLSSRRKTHWEGRRGDWEGSWSQNPGLWVDVPGCPGSSRDEGMGPCSCLSVLPGQPGPGPPVPGPQGSWPRAWSSSVSENVLQTPGPWGCGSECHMKGLHRAPGPALGPEGLEPRRSQGERQPRLLLRVSTPGPPCRRDNRAPGGAGGCVSHRGKCCRPVQGRVRQPGSKPLPPARSVPWAKLFKGKLLDLGGSVWAPL